MFKRIIGSRVRGGGRGKQNKVVDISHKILVTPKTNLPAIFDDSSAINTINNVEMLLQFSTNNTDTITLIDYMLVVM